MRVERVGAFVPETTRILRQTSVRLVLSQVARQVVVKIVEDLTKGSTRIRRRRENVGYDPLTNYHRKHAHSLDYFWYSKGGAPIDASCAATADQSGSGVGVFVHASSLSAASR